MYEVTLRGTFNGPVDAITTSIVRLLADASGISADAIVVISVTAIVDAVVLLEGALRAGATEGEVGALVAALTGGVTGFDGLYSDVEVTVIVQAADGRRLRAHRLLLEDGFALTPVTIAVDVHGESANLETARVAVADGLAAGGLEAALATTDPALGTASVSITRSAESALSLLITFNPGADEKLASGAITPEAILSLLVSDEFRELINANVAGVHVTSVVATLVDGHAFSPPPPARAQLTSPSPSPPPLALALQPPPPAPLNAPAKAVSAGLIAGGLIGALAGAALLAYCSVYVRNVVLRPPIETAYESVPKGDDEEEAAAAPREGFRFENAASSAAAASRWTAHGRRSLAEREEAEAQQAQRLAAAALDAAMSIDPPPAPPPALPAADPPEVEDEAEPAPREPGFSVDGATELADRSRLPPRSDASYFAARVTSAKRQYMSGLDISVDGTGGVGASSERLGQRPRRLAPLKLGAKAKAKVGGEPAQKVVRKINVAAYAQGMLLQPPPRDDAPAYRGRRPSIVTVPVEEAGRRRRSKSRSPSPAARRRTSTSPMRGGRSPSPLSARGRSPGPAMRTALRAQDRSQERDETARRQREENERRSRSRGPSWK